jgi:hypothetical protein
MGSSTQSKAAITNRAITRFSIIVNPSIGKKSRGRKRIMSGIRKEMNNLAVFMHEIPNH